MFNYTTGDAAGQNTTTTCTWHTCNWLIKKFNNESSFKIQKFYIESNGSSDKKISSKTVHNGRGIKVSADVFLPEKIINDVLKSSSAEMIDYTRRTTPISFYNGISSHNANVANLIAGIFSSTGQDIACVHESASAFGSFEKTSEGLYCSIKLPSLVIGTVGGGTHLPVQKNILSMMDCYGPKKVERFAKIIASFSLSLEISIIAAIASGQFAIAHERLGRNKLVDFVNKKEFKTDYIKNTVHSLDNIEFTDFSAKNNGILTQLTSLETQKHLGFSKWKGSIKNINQDIFIKSKPSNREVINSLYRTIGALDPRLASQFSNYQNFSEFNMSSIRELEVLEVLKNHNYLNMPKVYEIINDKNRESYHIIQEYIDHKNTQIFNSENNSHVWNKDILENVFTALYKGQNILTKNKENIPNLHTRNHKESLLFSKNMLDTLKAESSTKNEDLYKIIEQSISFLEQQPSDQYLQLVTHNDFNPRNIIVNKSEKVLIYDWELCSEGLPQKDSVEFLCFTKNSDHLKDMRTEDLLKVHFNLLSSDYPEVTVTDWKIMNKIALAQFITQRFSHYLVGSHLTEYNFLPNLISNTKLIFSELFNDQL